MLRDRRDASSFRRMHQDRFHRWRRRRAAMVAMSPGGALDAPHVEELQLRAAPAPRTRSSPRPCRRPRHSLPLPGCCCCCCCCCCCLRRRRGRGAVWSDLGVGVEVEAAEAEARPRKCGAAPLRRGQRVRFRSVRPRQCSASARTPPSSRRWHPDRFSVSRRVQALPPSTTAAFGRAWCQEQRPRSVALPPRAAATTPSPLTLWSAFGSATRARGPRARPGPRPRSPCRTRSSGA